MWDKIQKIISDSKSEMDIDQVDSSIWNKIDAKLNQDVRRKPNRGWMKIAAICVVVLAAGFFLLREQTQNNTNLISNEETLEEMFPEIVSAELFYLTSVQSLQMQIEASEFPKDSNELEYLAELDSVYVDLKIMLADDVNRDQIIAEMVHNLQLRISILQNQLMLVKEFEKRLNNQENEKPLI